MDSFFSVICSFVSCINFSLSFRNFRFVPRCCLASLKWKAVLLSAQQNSSYSSPPGRTASSSLRSWAWTHRAAWARWSSSPAAPAASSSLDPCADQPCQDLVTCYNHVHWPVDLLGADDGGGVAGGHVAHLQLAQRGPGQQGLRRADEGLGRDVGVRLRRYNKRLDQQLTLGSSCGFSKFSWLKLLSLSSWSSSSSTLFTTSSISSSLYSNLDTETSSAMKDTFLLLVGVSDLGLLLPEDKTTW